MIESLKNTPDELRAKGENENEFVVVRYKNGTVQTVYETISVGSESAAEVGETSTQVITITREILSAESRL